MYTTTNFKTKKELKQAVADGREVRVFQPNAVVADISQQGTHEVALEGPHYPKPHTWYAMALVVDGLVTKVR